MTPAMRWNRHSPMRDKIVCATDMGGLTCTHSSERASNLSQVATLQSYLGSEHPYTQLDWSKVPAFAKLGLDPQVDMQADEDLSAAMEAAMSMLQ